MFKRRPHTGSAPPDFPLATSDASRRRPRQTAPAAPADGSLQELAERQLLDRYAPAYVVINDAGEVLQSSGRTGKYLELPAGAPETNIFSLARTACGWSCARPSTSRSAAAKSPFRTTSP
jgi:two-component system CheB/CheR fusion protein